MTIQIRHRSDKRKEGADFDQKLGIFTNRSPVNKSKIAAVASSDDAEEKNTVSCYSAYIARTSEILLKRSQTFQ